MQYRINIWWTYIRVGPYMVRVHMYHSINALVYRSVDQYDKHQQHRTNIYWCVEDDGWTRSYATASRV